jgi:hyperosmotically inducible periplasmic protein
MRRHFSLRLAIAAQLFAASAGLFLLAPGFANAQTEPAPAIQKMSKPDRDLTRKIRRAVVSDKDLSVEAHNIHITAQDGAVTLVGNVKSDDEKKAIEDKATEIAGAGKVTSQLTVGGK